MTFDLPPSIPSVSKYSTSGFHKFIGRNPFDLRTKPSIFSSPPSSFSSSTNPFLAKNFCIVGEDAVATQTEATIVARSDIVVHQIDVKDDVVSADVADSIRFDVADNVVASIDPFSASSFDFFSHLPQPRTYLLHW